MTTANEADHTKRNNTANSEWPEGSASDRLGRQAREVTQDLREMGEIAKEVAQEKFEQVRSNASQCCEQGRDKLQQVEHTIEQYIRDRPLKSILIAAGIGLLFGRFWMRR